MSTRYRAHVDEPHHFVTRHVRVMVIEDGPGVVASLLTRTPAGVIAVPIDPNATPPDDPSAYLLDVPDDVGRAIYEALRNHYGDADVQPARELAKALAASEAARRYLEADLGETAVRLAGPPDGPVKQPDGSLLTRLRRQHKIRLGGSQEDHRG